MYPSLPYIYKIISSISIFISITRFVKKIRGCIFCGHLCLNILMVQKKYIFYYWLHTQIYISVTTFQVQLQWYKEKYLFLFSSTLRIKIRLRAISWKWFAWYCCYLFYTSPAATSIKILSTLSPFSGTIYREKYLWFMKQKTVSQINKFKIPTYILKA